MNTPSFDHIRNHISLEQLHHRAPAAFAERPFARTSASYVFISTAELLNALLDAGFEPTEAKQARARGERSGYARHMIRFRHIRESMTLVDAVPELILINSHDASSAYELRCGLYRPVCTNGLLARIGDFDVIHVPHRGDVVANVVEGARRIMQGFAGLGEIVERMARTELTLGERDQFAQAALHIRYRDGQHVPFSAGRLLAPRRESDAGCDLWRTYNVVQERVMTGGIPGTTVQGRRTHSRRIRAIREDVRINTALWHEAMQLLRA